jgi:hypothetical protein
LVGSIPTPVFPATDRSSAHRCWDAGDEHGNPSHLPDWPKPIGGVFTRDQGIDGDFLHSHPSARPLLTELADITDGSVTHPQPQEENSKMTFSYYAISLQPSRMIANEVAPDEAALLLDAGHAILLAAPVDLVRVALRHHRPVTIFSRDDVRRSARTGKPSASRSSRSTGRSAKSHVAHSFNESAELDPACRRGSSVRSTALV